MLKNGGTRAFRVSAGNTFDYNHVFVKNGVSSLW